MDCELSDGRNAGKVFDLIENIAELIQEDLGRICTEKPLDLVSFHTAVEATGELLEQLEDLCSLVNRAYGID